MTKEQAATVREGVRLMHETLRCIPMNVLDAAAQEAADALGLPGATFGEDVIDLGQSARNIVNSVPFVVHPTIALPR